MAFVEWTETLSVGDAGIDEDHQKLVSYVNELHGAMGKGKGKEVLGPILAKLVQYTHQHFSREEAVWAKGSYLRLAEHKRQHEDLLKKVDDFTERFSRGDALLTLELLNFLRDWLVTHIQQSDQAAARSLR
jgi:hemerythrin-like metal-binding protein